MLGVFRYIDFLGDFLRSSENIIRCDRPLPVELNKCRRRVFRKKKKKKKKEKKNGLFFFFRPHIVKIKNVLNGNCLTPPCPVVFMENGRVNIYIFFFSPLIDITKRSFYL